MTGQIDDDRAPARARYSNWVIVRTEHRELVVDRARRAAEAIRR